MNINEFNYDLPKELIAQFPTVRRDQSRLLIVDRKRGSITHSVFEEIVDLFKPGDALVINDAKVRPVRLIGNVSGKKIDILLVERVKKNLYLVKAKPAARLKPGAEIEFYNKDVTALYKQTESSGQRGLKLLEFMQELDIESKLDQLGMMPLPPYIKRIPDDQDSVRYQTVYAKAEGAIAAPTAGLHFTKQILSKLEQKQVDIATLTLNVGLGTFVPVRVENIKEHKMHSEYFELSQSAAATINQVIKNKGRVCAVGTTAARVLETCAGQDNNRIKLQPKADNTDLFIYPPYKFKAADMLLTNFHLPRTTLLMLVYAFAGEELCRRAYSEAIKQRYRFYSYGDCMLII